MKGLVLASVTLLAAVSCSALFRASQAAEPALAAPDAAPCDCPDPGIELREVMVERDQCQAELAQQPAPETRVRVQTKIIERPTQPTGCSASKPTIVAVPTTECVDGMACLDTAGKAAMASNLLAYEAYVQACEAEAKGKANQSPQAGGQAR